MSRLHEQTLACPDCGQPLEVGVTSSVNATRRDDLREAILADRFQRETCPHCGAGFRLEPDLTYLDAKRGQWVLVLPARDLPLWADLEDNARRAFDRAYGEAAPPEARALGQRMQSRIAFGWPALREKLLCVELGVDDVALELTKLAVMRSMDEMPLSDTTELRLVGRDDAGALRLQWGRSDAEGALEELTVPRELVDEIGSDAAWAAVRAEMAAGPFVDVNRLLLPAEA